MSIASEIQRLQTSKADIKAQVNIDVDDINEGTDFIDEETLDDYADLIEDMQEAYKQYIPINSTSDTQIEAPKGGAIIGKTIKGNTSQDGTPTPSSPVPVNNVTGEQVVKVCGKNLFNSANSSNYFINTSTGEIQSSTKWTQSNYFKIEPNTTYTISTTTNPCGSSVFEISEYTNTKTWIKSTQKGSTTSNFVSFTTTNTTEFMIVGYRNDLISPTVQLEKNSSATNFEEYQGKDYEINLGKNLANPSNFKFYTQANASCSYDYDTNTLTMTTLREVTSGELFFCSKIDDNLLKNGKAYTLSNVNVSGVVTSLKLQLRNKNGTNANKPQGTSITYDNNYSLFIVGNPFASSGATVVPQGTIAVIKDMQVEEGSSATNFSPYFEPIELCKIGNYQDRIYKNDGKWYIEKYVDKIQVTSSMTWYKSTTTAVDKYYTRVGDWDSSLNRTSYSNRFKFSTNSNNVGDFDYSQNGTYLALFFCYAEYNTSTINSFKTWLDSNSTYCVIPKVVPTFIEITNEELLNQLDRIMQLYEGQNNILVTGDLAATLDLDYIVKAENHL